MPITPTSDSLGLARQKIAGLLRDAGWSDDAIADAQLVATELLSNAINHAEPPLDLGLGLDSEQLTIVVGDHSPDRPARILPEDRKRIGGWGLAIVAHVAPRWGVRIVGSRKEVWAVVCRELTTTPPP